MDSDNDSLFGSPPPSPTRGRSPLLALPEDSGWRMENAILHTQNVGTIALPGSQNNFSKIPAQPAVPSACDNRPPFLKLKPASVENREQAESTSRRSKPAKATTATTTTTTKTTSCASHSRNSAKRHSERMDRTLSDLVSLISHFGPPQSIRLPLSVGSVSSASQEGTKENPIQVDDARKAPTPIDAVNNALIALATTVASALKLPSVPQDRPPLSEPAVHQVLQCIKHDPKLIPTLHATHEYLNSVPRYPRDEVSNPVDDAAPSKSKRKRKHAGPRIPAGAEHWDVPFPFAPGHAPAGYPTQWQLERGRRVLGELLGLFERAFVQSRVKNSFISETPSEPPAKRPRLSSTERVLPTERSDDMQVDNQVSSVLDTQRMTEWLSSLHTLPTTESIIESTSTSVPSSSADVSPFDFSLDDISNIMDVHSPDIPIPSQHPIIDFTQLFDNFDWQSLNSDYGAAANAAPPASTGIDSTPLVDSLPRSAYQDATPSVFSAAPIQDSPCVDLDSLEGMFASVAPSTNTQYHRNLAQSMQTIPTASGSSSVREGTPLESFSSETLSAQNIGLWAKDSGSTQSQRRTLLLLRAREYQNQLLHELEKTALKRWELQIEDGVLQNFKKAATGYP